jgi:cytochrome c biogenesis protein
VANPPLSTTAYPPGLGEPASPMPGTGGHGTNGIGTNALTTKGPDAWLLQALTGIFKVFQSLPLAIVLLSSLAVGVMLGVFIPQEGLVELQDIKRQFGQWYLPLKAMGAFNVYASYWFLTLEVLFFFNLLAGSFRWLKPAFMAATYKNTLPAIALQKAKPTWVWQIPASVNPQMVPTSVIETLMNQHRYRQRATSAAVPQQQATPSSTTGQANWTCAYWTKGSWTRFGPAVAHIGILSLLMASVFGAFTGFKAQKAAVPGQQFSLSQTDTFTTGVPSQFWQGQLPNWQLKVQDFKVEVYADHPETVKQYYCSLQVLSAEGKPLKSEVISVNHPLQMGPVMVYQASFAPTGKLFLHINGKPVSVKATDHLQDRPVAWVPLANAQHPQDKRILMLFPFFVQQDPGVKQNYLVAFVREGNRFVGQQKGKMPVNLRLLPGQSGQLLGVNLHYDRPELMTGLQIKSAPETAWIYLSFLIISIGTLMCFFAQRRLWLALAPDYHTETKALTGYKLYLLPKTNKGKLGFQQELTDLSAKLATNCQAVCVQQGGPFSKYAQQS